MTVESPARAPWLLVALLGIVLAYPTHAWHTYRNVNETARIYLVQAVVEHGVLHIDHGIAQYGDVHDKAHRDGHDYCDKPIGLSLAALGPYALLFWGAKVFGHEWSLPAIRFLLTLICVTLPSLGLCLLLHRYWQEITGNAGLAGVAIVAFALGTITSTYATQFMGHAPSALLLFAHFYLSRRGTLGPRRLALLGLLAGAGAITEYFSAVAHGLIVLGYARRVADPRMFAALIAGGLAAISPLLFYNAHAFGSPFSLSYGHEALPEFQELHSTGFFGVTWPRAASVWGLLFSPAKGLLWLSPFLALGAWGIVEACRRPAQRAEAAMAGLVALAIGALALSVVDWRAGWTVGPRHMVSMLPFLMTGVVWAASARAWVRTAFIASALCSSVALVATTLTFPAFAIGLGNPLLRQTAFLLAHGHVSPNLLVALGAPGAIGLLVPLFAVAGAWVVALGGGLGSVARPAWARSARRSMPWIAAYACVWTMIVLSYRPEPPGVAEYWQGRVLALGDREDAARERFEAGLASRPAGAVVEKLCRELLAIHQRRQDLDAATALVARWLELDPGSSQARDLRAQLERIRGRPAGE